MAIHGVLTIELAPRKNGGATLALTYAVGGYADVGLARLAGAWMKRMIHTTFMYKL